MSSSSTEPLTLHRSQVNGSWVDAYCGATLEVLDPSTEQVIAQVPAGDARDVDKAVASARRASDDWARTPPRERADMLIALADRLRFFAGAGRCLEGRSAGEYMRGYTSMIRREALGVAGKAPAVVLDDADPDYVASTLRSASFWNAGQDCSAAARVIVTPGRYEEVLAALVREVGSLRVGDPVGHEGRIDAGSTSTLGVPSRRWTNQGGRRAGDDRATLPPVRESTS